MSIAACSSTSSMSNVERGDNWIAACGPNDLWDKPGPPYKIYGNTYYVGTCGIAAILITGDDGHVLIDSGTAQGARIVAGNVRALGYDVDDIRILLHSHEHFDHVGGMAFLKGETGAQVIASRRAAPVLETGIVAADDPQASMHAPFAAVEVTATIAHLQTVNLGLLELTALETPGHSPGALSWQWIACEETDCKTMVYLDSLSPISRDGYRFSDHPKQLAQYRAGLNALEGIACDFALTPHPIASSMHQRLGQPGGLEDKNGCRAYVNRIEGRLDQRLKSE
ncbi:MAG: subclass B3 metallo-beta-lactamase [Woeseiaceae bacterium]